MTTDELVTRGYALHWLAGLLEGEGTFLKPPPSGPRLPIVSCRMTDLDIIERVAGMLGNRVLAIDKGRYRTEYAVTVKGSRAVSLMRDLRPLMGVRRTKAIDAALEAYAPPNHKLNFGMAEEIRSRYANGETISQLSRAYGVARSTIRPVLQGRIYGAPKPAPWLTPVIWLPGIPAPPLDISVADFAWLAGWLEGEGSFCAPPPSSPLRPRIAAQAVDRDVVARAGSMMGVSALHKPSSARNPKWTPMWSILKSGRGAAELMEALFTLMGLRRQKQIRRAVQLAMAAQERKRGAARRL